MSNNTSPEMETQEKKELQASEEKTVPSRSFVPYGDIYETANALTLILEMPGVERDNVSINLDSNVLAIEGNIDFADYSEMRSLYTEYNVGHYSRKFNLSNEIDQNGISAEMQDGVLTLHLPKVEKAKPRKIQIN